MNNTVELLNIMGDDLMVVNVARVSYGKESNEINDKDIRLLKYLYEHKHTSPWRHPQLQFRITCPIFVERQLFKHQIGMSANSISGRYVDFSDTYWEPSILREQSKDSKQGSGNQVMREDLIKKMKHVILYAKNTYKELIAEGISKELARTILPLSLNTTFIWTGSMLAFLHLFELRLKPDAQEETRLVAAEMLKLVRQTGKFEQTLKAWGY
ncbi:MAG: FAD-dependent thymidylate synthase [Burkholderiaceae bacterium]|nr:FAD-dependent thymidylate synthase [Burkholderiaceae bacterium]